MSYDDDMYPQGEEEYYDAQQEGPAGPEIISTSQAVNLTSTIASFFGLAALFLCFADQRSHAIRRFAIQSVGLLVIQVGLGLVCLLLAALLGWIPLVGYVLCLLLWIAFLAVCVLVLLLRVRMMVRAYRGEAYVLPAVGEMLRRFE